MAWAVHWLTQGIFNGCGGRKLYVGVFSVSAPIDCTPIVILLLILPLLLPLCLSVCVRGREVYVCIFVCAHVPKDMIKSVCPWLYSSVRDGWAGKKRQE